MFNHIEISGPWLELPDEAVERMIPSRARATGPRLTISRRAVSSTGMSFYESLFVVWASLLSATDMPNGSTMARPSRSCRQSHHALLCGNLRNRGGSAPDRVLLA